MFCSALVTLNTRVYLQSLLCHETAMSHAERNIPGHFLDTVYSLEPQFKQITDAEKERWWKVSLSFQFEQLSGQ